MKQTIIVLSIGIAVLLLASACLAEDDLKRYYYDNNDDVSFFIGERTWQSIGSTRWNIAGTEGGGPPNILSELEFLELKSTVVEIFGGFRAGRGALTVDYCFGSMHGGRYRDSDYLSDDRQDMFSLSTGSADGEDWNSLYYWDIKYNYRLATNEPEDPLWERYLDLVIGYQRWHENIHFFNGVQTEDPFNLFGLGPFAGLNSRYEFTWTNYLLGFEGGLPIFRGFLAKVSTIFIPYNEYEGKGFWNLRTDFMQDPSFLHKANGGYGVQLDGSFLYYIFSQFSAELGYRYWYIKSGKGTDTTFFSDGTVGITRFNEAVSFRHGAFLSLRYAF